MSSVLGFRAEDLVGKVFAWERKKGDLGRQMTPDTMRAGVIESITQSGNRLVVVLKQATKPLAVGPRRQKTVLGEKAVTLKFTLMGKPKKVRGELQFEFKMNLLRWEGYITLENTRH